MNKKPRIGDLVSIENIVFDDDRLGIVVATSGIYCQIKWCGADVEMGAGRRKEYTEVRRDALKVF